MSGRDGSGSASGRVRAWLAVAAVVPLLALAGCDDDRQTIRIGADDETTTTTTGSAGSDGSSVSDALDMTWVDLPPAPIGDWPLYHWVWLADGSGFVIAGASRSSSGGDPESTAAAAAFSFDSRSYTELPELPTKGGLGIGRGAWIGDRLVLVGQDCEPSLGPSFGGSALCLDGGGAHKVTLTYRRGADSWEQSALPDWLGEFPYGVPGIVGVRDGRLIMATSDVPAHVGALDPESGSWDRLDDAPFLAPTGNDADGAALSFGGPAARVCMAGDELLAFAIGGAGYTVDEAAVPPPSTPNRWWRYGDDGWTEIDPMVTGAIVQVNCASAGLYAVRRLGGTGGRSELVTIDVSTGESTTADLSDSIVSSPDQQFGDSIMVSGIDGLGTSGHQGRLATPHGIISTPLDEVESALLFGHHYIRTNDASSTDGHRRAPQIAHVVPG